MLFRSLQAVLRGEHFEEYRPQRRYLYVLNLGDGTSLAIYGSLAWRGWLAWKLKNYVGRRFMRSLAAGRLSAIR